MKLIRYLGYAAFFLVMFVFGLYYTFPWDAAKDRILEIASRESGMAISAGSLEPSWLTGIVAHDVKITPQGASTPMSIERLSARAKVLSFLGGKRGFSVALPIAKGDLSADVVMGAETVDVKAEAKSVELGLVPGLTDAIGLPLTGATTLKTEMVLGLKDPKATQGNLALKLTGLKIEKGGKMSGFPIPELSIGDLDWQIPIEAGKATFKTLKVAGDSVEMSFDGSILLLNPISRSTANLTVSFKPTDKLLKAEPLLGALLNNIQQAKGSDGFYTYAMNGPVKSPHFTPRRR
jgi:type II secretion system protein N